MKKIIVFVTVLFIASTNIAFAANLAANVANAGLTVKATAPAAVDISKFSKGVFGGAEYSAAGYSIVTFHNLGNKAYGTSYDATALYFKPDMTSATFAAPTDSNAAVAFAGWTKM